MHQRNAIPTRTKTSLLPKVDCFVQITMKVRNNESLVDKQIHFASELLRIVHPKDRTNDVYNTGILDVDNRISHPKNGQIKCVPSRNLTNTTSSGTVARKTHTEILLIWHELGTTRISTFPKINVVVCKPRAIAW